MEKTALRNNKPILSLILYEADKSKTILSNSAFHDSYSFVYLQGYPTREQMKNCSLENLVSLYAIVYMLWVFFSFFCKNRM